MSSVRKLDGLSSVYTQTRLKIWVPFYRCEVCSHLTLDTKLPVGSARVLVAGSMARTCSAMVIMRSAPNAWVTQKKIEVGKDFA
jgi:hypothetical protein